jgi:hypothetical protein
VEKGKNYARSADERLFLCHCSFHLSRDAKIRELDLASVCEKDVPTLDVAVHLVLLVKVLESLEAFNHHAADLWLFEPSASETAVEVRACVRACERQDRATSGLNGRAFVQTEWCEVRAVWCIAHMERCEAGALRASHRTQR